MTTIEKLTKALACVGLILLLCAFELVLALPAIVDDRLNTVRGNSLPISERARQLHRSLLIVDLHADSLLWDRDLLKRNNRGHIDVPRLIEGNVALQAFTIVSKVPRKRAEAGAIDQISLLAVVGHWPNATWTSLKERVIFQTTKLETFCQKSNGKLFLIRSCSDLDSYLKKRQRDQLCTAGFIGVEGAHALEGNLNNVDLFFDHGVRMMSPSHFFDNDIGGSSHGKGVGLTPLGKEMIRRMQAKQMIIDLAHASSATIKDTLEISTKPVLVSHTGVRGTCDNARNLSNDEIKAIARNGGIIGIGYWPEATCGNDARAIARAMRFTTDLIGVEHVALGSDFDGATTAPFDASGLVSITQALIDEHFSDKQIRLIMGGNAIRFLRAALPAS